MLSQLDGSTERADSITNTLVKRPYGTHAIGNLDVWSFDAEKWDMSRQNLGALIDAYSKK